jgi:hypothetical protein
MNKEFVHPRWPNLSPWLITQRIIIIHLLSLAPTGFLASPDNGAVRMTQRRHGDAILNQENSRGAPSGSRFPPFHRRYADEKKKENEPERYDHRQTGRDWIQKDATSWVLTAACPRGPRRSDD